MAATKVFAGQLNILANSFIYNNAGVLTGRYNAQFGLDGSYNLIVAANAITATELNAAAVTAGKIATGGVSAAGQFAAGVVDSAALGAASVIAGKYGAGSLVDADVNASAAIAQTKLGVWSQDQSANNKKITNLTDPGNAQDAATKAYVDSVSIGLLDFKNSVRLATNAALPANTRSGNVLTASANGALSTTGVDGVTTGFAVNDRILVKDEATGANNGIYRLSALGDGTNPWTLTRTTDADDSTEVTAGMYMWVDQGTANADMGFVLTTPDPITLNTTALTFVQFTGLGQITPGNGLTKTGNVINAVAFDTALVMNVDDIKVNYDDATLGLVATKLAIKNSGVTATQLATSIFPTGSGLTGGAGTTVSVVIQKDIFSGGSGTSVLSSTPLAGSEMLFLNGVYQRVGSGNAYTSSSATISWATTPPASATIDVFYHK